jgi:radical SAM protein with 4Fe4S-binding SPASM domain
MEDAQPRRTRPKYPVRAVDPEKDLGKPIYAVWEITLRCDHACDHCGSRAVKARPDELSTDEMFDVADRLVAMGSREVTLIGGEAYLRPDCPDLVHRLASQGVRVTMQTGGRGLTAERCKVLKDAGIAAIGVSIDGPPEIHDLLRASKGSHAAALRALDHCRDHGIVTSSNMQVNRLSWHFLRQTFEEVKAHGIRAWRCQLTVPMGRAADRPEWLLEPWRILEVIDTLAAMKTEEAERTRAAGRPIEQMVNITLGNNIGYYGPHEELLRSLPGLSSQYWSGCAAGKYTIGIESDGRVKACPSLPTHPYTGGNLREIPLEQLWETPELRFARDRTPDELWGFCKGCYYADVCMAGCSWTSHVTLGKRGNMPWCYHRASTLKKQGLRERIRRVVEAEGIPYDYGKFELVVEPWEDEPQVTVPAAAK